MAQSYTVTVGARTNTFTAADIDAAQSNTAVRVYVRNSGANSQSLTVSRPGTSGRFTYKYVAAGFWQDITDGTTSVAGSLDSFAFGFPTATAAVPVRGRGEYTLDYLGARTLGNTLTGFTGTGTAQVDFSTGELTLSGALEYAGGGYDPFSGNALIASGSNSLSGGFSLGFDITGQLRGMLFGPAGEEIGGTFSGQGRGDPGALVSGVFMGRGGVIPSLPFDANAVNTLTTGLTGTIANSGSAISDASLRNAPIVFSFDAASNKYTLINAERSLVIGADQTIQFARTTDRLTPVTTGGTYSDVRAWSWRENKGRASDALLVSDLFVTGTPTPVGAVPASGTAGYLVRLSGEVADSAFGGFTSFGGDGTLYLDFVTGGLTTEGRGTIIDQAMGSRAIGFSASATLGSARNGFDGTFATTGAATYSGSWNGLLYGATAAELGSTLSLTGASGSIATGVLLGKRSADLDLNLAKLAELTAPTQLRAAHVVMSGGNPLINYNSDLQVTYDPAANTYAFNTDRYTLHSAPALTVGAAQRDAARSTAAETVYNVTWPDHSGSVRVYNATSATAPLQLTYTSFATISFSRDAPPGLPPGNRQFLAYLLGIQTPRAQIPITGSASYTGVIGGGAASYGGGNTRNYDLSGTSRFSMDFGTSALTGQLDILGTDMTSGALRDFGRFAVSGQVEGYSAVQSGFASARGNITGTDVDTGVFSGLFFGPRGTEFGGVFELRQRVLGGDDTHFNGVTVAKQCAASGC